MNVCSLYFFTLSNVEQLIAQRLFLVRLRSAWSAFMKKNRRKKSVVNICERILSVTLDERQTG